MAPNGSRGLPGIPTGPFERWGRQGRVSRVNRLCRFYLSYHSYRLGYLFVGVVSVLGNLIYVMGTEPWIIILARMLCGLEGGVLRIRRLA